MSEEKATLPTTAFATNGLLTRSQLLHELNITSDTLREWEKRKLPRVAQGKKLFYHVPTVIKWMLKNKTQ
jgi:DNA-binding transcriptional regulator YiaG